MMKHENDDRPVARGVKTGLKVLGLFVLAVFLTHLSWNMFAPDLFGQHAMRFREALGLVLFATVVGALIGRLFNGAHGHRIHHKSESVS